MKTSKERLLVRSPEASQQNSASTLAEKKANKVTFSSEDPILLDIEDYEVMSSSGAAGDNPNYRDESRKSERKRKRERQRRSDLANAFDELGVLLSSMDQESGDGSHARRRRRRSSGDESSEVEHADNTGMTRLDLITRSIDAIRRLRGENDELKQRLEQQRVGRDNRDVFVMMPTLTPADQEDSSPGSRSSYQTHSYYQQPHPSQHQPVGTGSHDIGGGNLGYYSGVAHGSFPYGQQPSSGWGNQPPMMMMMHQQQQQQQQQPYHARYPPLLQQQQPLAPQHPEANPSSTFHEPGSPHTKPQGKS